MSSTSSIRPGSAVVPNSSYARGLTDAVKLADAIAVDPMKVDSRRVPELADALDSIRNDAACPKLIGRFLTSVERLVGRGEHSGHYNAVLLSSALRLAAQLSGNSGPLLTIAKELQAAQQVSASPGLNWGDHRKAVAACAADAALGDQAPGLRRAVNEMVAGLQGFSPRWQTVTAAAAAAKDAINQARFG